jgi:hypothetical protein
VPRPDPRPYPPEARARAALSLAARQLSDSARAMVPTFADDHAQRGDFVEEAVRLRALADEVLARAVVLERERRTTWEGIGAALGGDGEPRTRQTAEARFGELVRQWGEALVRPWWPHPDGETVYCALPDGAEDPGFWAGRLDKWVLRHAEPTDVVDHLGGERPVSAGLNADPWLLVPTEETLLRKQALDLQARRVAGERPVAAEVAAFHRRRRAMLAWVDEVLPATTTEASLRDTLQGARDRLVQLAELVPATPEPTP